MDSRIEILVQACRIGNQVLIELLAKIWTRGINDEIKGPFRDSLFEIIDTYAVRWVKAIDERDEAEVRVLSKVAIEGLIAAAGTGNAIELSIQLTAFVLVNLRLVLDPNPVNAERMNWLLHEAEPMSEVAVGLGGELLAGALVTVGMQFFLALRPRSLDCDDLRLHEILVGISTKVLEQIARADLILTVKAWIQHLAEERLKRFSTRYRRRAELFQLEDQFSYIFDSISGAGSHIPSLLATVEVLRGAIAVCGTEARYDLI